MPAARQFACLGPASGGSGQQSPPESFAARCRRKFSCPESFADLGVSRAVAGALQASAASHTPFPIQELVIADVLAGRDVLAKSPTGSGKTLAFGVPLDRPHRGRRPPPGGAGPRPHARAGRPDRRRAAPAGAGPQPQRGRRLRRRRLREADPRRAARPHPRRHPRPARGPAPAPRLHARPGADARARRGRPDARHGLPPGRRPDRRPVPARAPDAVLLGHARRRGRPHRQGLHARRRAPRAHAAEAAAAPTSSTASWPSSTTQKLRVLVRRARRHRHGARLRAHQARRRPARQAPVTRGRAGRRHARRQVAGPARARARLVRGRRRRHAGGDRRRRPRHRRRRHLARHQLRPAGRPRGLRPPRRPHRPRRRAPASASPSSAASTSATSRRSPTSCGSRAQSVA